MKKSRYSCSMAQRLVGRAATSAELTARWLKHHFRIFDSYPAAPRTPSGGKRGFGLVSPAVAALPFQALDFSGTRAMMQSGHSVRHGSSASTDQERA